MKCCTKLLGMLLNSCKKYNLFKAWPTSPPLGRNAPVKQLHKNHMHNEVLPQLDKVLVTASGVKNHNHPKHAPAQFKSTPDFFDQVILYLVKCHGTLFSFSALSLMLRVSKWWK